MKFRSLPVTVLKLQSFQKFWISILFLMVAVYMSFCWFFSFFFFCFKGIRAGQKEHYDHVPMAHVHVRIKLLSDNLIACWSQAPVKSTLTHQWWSSPIDDHMVHRDHGVLDTIIISDGLSFVSTIFYLCICFWWFILQSSELNVHTLDDHVLEILHIWYWICTQSGFLDLVRYIV